MKTRISVLILLAGLLTLGGCSSTYDATLETFGKQKKDTLIDRITEARDAQIQAREQFASALDQFRSIAGYRGFLLEEKYKELNAQYKECQSQTRTVEARLADVRRAARSLFRQWEDEMETFSSSVARRSSEEKLKQTQAKYETVINAMENVTGKFYPALTAFKDQILLLKHNINAQATVASGPDLTIAEREISLLTVEIDRAQAQADTFIRQMRLE